MNEQLSLIGGDEPCPADALANLHSTPIPSASDAAPPSNPTVRLSETFRDEIRCSPEYLPPCPLCSFIGVEGFTNLLRYPSLTRGHRPDKEGRYWFSLSHCCSLSRDCPWMPERRAVSSWWREVRLCTLGNLALDNRRKSTLAKLAAAGLEAL